MGGPRPLPGGTRVVSDEGRGHETWGPGTPEVVGMKREVGEGERTEEGRRAFTAVESVYVSVIIEDVTRESEIGGMEERDCPHSEMT